jgi:hypothetical protein
MLELCDTLGLVPLIDLALDDVGTWPARLMATFDAHEALLRAYHTEEQRTLDDDAWRPPNLPDYVPMALRPSNPFFAERQQFLGSLRSEYFAELALRGFHCTRLTDDEVERIRAEGMTPPSLESLQRRISALASGGLISTRAAQRMARENDASDPTRAGRIWFVFTAAPLRCQTGVESLFRYWGGESLYRRHDRDPETGPIVTSVGVARIVEAIVPLADIGPTAFPDKQFVQQFLAARGVAVLDRDYVDRVVVPIPAERIRRVVSRSDDAFASLTGCANWRPALE